MPVNVFCCQSGESPSSLTLPSFISNWLFWDPGTELPSLPWQAWNLELDTHAKMCTSSSLRGQVSAFPEEYWSGDIFHFMISSILTLCNIVFHFRWGIFCFLILLLIYHPAFAPMTVSDILCRNPASPHDICSLVQGIVCIPSSATTLYSQLHLAWWWSASILGEADPKAFYHPSARVSASWNSKLPFFSAKQTTLPPALLESSSPHTSRKSHILPPSR